MAVDITALVRAVDRFEEGLARYRQDESDDQIRDGLIQRFEFTYELSHRVLRRYLASIAPSPDEVATMAFADLIRTANQHDLLLGDWPAWRTYREMRNRTSHTYREDVAREVVASLPGFLDEARQLRDRLQERLS